MLEATYLARTVAPLSRMTPTARSRSTIISRTPASVSISAPCSRADRAGAKTFGQVRRRTQHELAQHIGDRLELAGKAFDGVRVMRAEFCNRRQGPAFAGEQVAAIGRGQKILRAALDDSQAMLGKL